jgi:uncharacterized protein
MKLDVIETDNKPWYEQGLKFTCQQCGNCCTGGPGYVWVSNEELGRLAEYLQLTVDETIQRYCRKVEGKWSLKEVRREGLYDCIFLTEIKPAQQNGNAIPQTRRGCSVYPVRPLQCRTWPFWEGNLRSQAAWKRAGKGCHGIDRGREFTVEEIVELRDAKDWPQRPPTSGHQD